MATAPSVGVASVLLLLLAGGWASVVGAALVSGAVVVLAGLFGMGPDLVSRFVPPNGNGVRFVPVSRMVSTAVALAVPAAIVVAVLRATTQPVFSVSRDVAIAFAAAALLVTAVLDVRTACRWWARRRADAARRQWQQVLERYGPPATTPRELRPSVDRLGRMLASPEPADPTLDERLCRLLVHATIATVYRLHSRGVDSFDEIWRATLDRGLPPALLADLPARARLCVPTLVLGFAGITRPWDAGCAAVRALGQEDPTIGGLVAVLGEQLAGGADVDAAATGALRESQARGRPQPLIDAAVRSATVPDDPRTAAACVAAVLAAALHDVRIPDATDPAARSAIRLLHRQVTAPADGPPTVDAEAQTAADDLLWAVSSGARLALIDPEPLRRYLPW